jgi:hypothetical protein
MVKVLKRIWATIDPHVRRVGASLDELSDREKTYVLTDEAVNAMDPLTKGIPIRYGHDQKEDMRIAIGKIINTEVKRNPDNTIESWHAQLEFSNDTPEARSMTRLIDSGSLRAVSMQHVEYQEYPGGPIKYMPEEMSVCPFGQRGVGSIMHPHTKEHIDTSLPTSALVKRKSACISSTYGHEWDKDIRVIQAAMSDPAPNNGVPPAGGNAPAVGGSATSPPSAAPAGTAPAPAAASSSSPPLAQPPAQQQPPAQPADPKEQEAAAKAEADLKMFQESMPATMEATTLMADLPPELRNKLVQLFGKMEQDAQETKEQLVAKDQEIEAKLAEKDHELKMVNNTLRDTAEATFNVAKTYTDDSAQRDLKRKSTTLDSMSVFRDAIATRNNNKRLRGGGESFRSSTMQQQQQQQQQYPSYTGGGGAAAAGMSSGAPTPLLPIGRVSAGLQYTGSMKRVSAALDGSGTRIEISPNQDVTQYGQMGYKGAPLSYVPNWHFQRRVAAAMEQHKSNNPAHAQALFNRFVEEDIEKGEFRPGFGPNFRHHFLSPEQLAIFFDDSRDGTGFEGPRKFMSRDALSELEYREQRLLDDENNKSFKRRA